jgi:hypothetical protein
MSLRSLDLTRPRLTLPLALLLASAWACGGKSVDPASTPASNADAGPSPAASASQGGAGSTGSPGSAPSTGSGPTGGVGPSAVDAGPAIGVSVPESDAGAGAASIDAGLVFVGSGSFTVMSDDPTAVESPQYEQSASFILETACPTTTVGFCSIRTCNATAAAGPAPNVGQVQFTGGQMSTTPLQPAADGTYTRQFVTGQPAWTTAGEPISVSWAHFPGDATQPGGSIQLDSPAYLTLAPGSTFAARSATLSRSQDLMLAWTAETTPSGEDQLLVDLDAGATQISCSFAASASSGVIPAGVLSYLPAAMGTFDVHSKQYASQIVLGPDSTPWQIAFNVDAHALTSYGVSYGSVTFQ